MSENYQLVRLVNGAFSVRSLAENETFHPVIGPAAEAEALYVNQLKLRERLRNHAGEFVVWDVGLGAAANVLAVIRAASEFPCPLRVISFDWTIEPLRFAVENADKLGYLAGYEKILSEFIEQGRVSFSRVEWEWRPGDFPGLMKPNSPALPPPHAILFDAFSPARNPAMWSAPLFRDLFRRLDPNRPCAMPTYSRSTMLRVTLLLAGFYVGVGHATGEKEETTIAANSLELLHEPLPTSWLQRVRKSKSAEPLREPVYRQSPLSAESWEELVQHPQFTSSRS
ncbi:MAG TPA: MnmC family methyltransferase [Verrucomicrobiae bacterium]